MKRWIPQQHGAWAMLAIPALLGILRGQHVYLWTLVPLWFVGYFAFYALSQWLKAPASRRRRLAAPIVAYGAVTAGLGVATLVLGGWQLVSWLAVFAPLMATSLWFVAHKGERSLTNGLLTIAAAAAFVGPCVYPWLPDAVRDVPLLVVMALLAAYFGGTVFAVKAMIRKRGDDRWWFASVAYHAAVVGVVGLGVLWGLVGWLWLVLAVLWCVRAGVFPWLQRRGAPVKPVHLGLVEIVLSVAVFAVALT